MLNRCNKNVKPLDITPGDYVYLFTAHSKIGNKLSDRYSGPFVVDTIDSPHLIRLRNPETNRCMRQPVHINRLKIAYVRQPTPKAYLVPPVSTHMTQDQADGHKLSPRSTPTQRSSSADTVSRDKIAPIAPRRSTRLQTKIRCPQSAVSGQSDTDLDSSRADSQGYYKIRKVLAQRIHNGKKQFRVCLRDESSQLSFWVPHTALDQNALRAIVVKPPPWIV
jgi:hypothetical protein